MYVIDQRWVHFNSGLYLGAGQHATCEVPWMLLGLGVVTRKKEPLLVPEKMASRKKPLLRTSRGDEQLVSNKAKLVYFFSF